MVECARLNIQSNLPLKLTYFDLILARPEGQNLESADALNRDEADRIIELLKSMADRAALEAWGAGQTSLIDDSSGEG